MVTLGDRIKLARSKAGLSLRAVAEKVGLSHTAISKYERGIDTPNSAVLLRLADALGVRLDFFFRQVRVELEPEAIHYRCRNRFGEKARQRVHGEVIECLERYLEVESLFDEPAPFLKPVADFAVKGLDEIENLALALREEWDLGTDPIDNLMAVLEDKGVRVCLVQGDDGFDGLSAWFQGNCPIMAVQRGVPGDRQRFDLAHELAHLLLDVSPGIDEEKAAHRFAGAFLAPEPAVRAELGERRRALDPYELYLLKHKYGLSMQAWMHRARDLGIIREDTYQTLCRRFSRMGWRKREPWEQVPAEEPGRVKQLVYRALAEDEISRSRAEELLGEPLVEVVSEAA